MLKLIKLIPTTVLCPDKLLLESDKVEPLGSKATELSGQAPKLLEGRHWTFCGSMWVSGIEQVTSGSAVWKRGSSSSIPLGTLSI